VGSKYSIPLPSGGGGAVDMQMRSLNFSTVMTPLTNWENLAKGEIDKHTSVNVEIYLDLFLLITHVSCQMND
jgi:hypothetical protein